MFSRLGVFVTHNSRAVILFWVVLAATVQILAPSWDDVTNDGDFAFLPDDMPSVVGERLTEVAFPEFRAKSQIVLIVARESQPLGSDDLRVADELARRFHNYLGIAGLRRAANFESEAREAEGTPEEDELLAQAQTEFEVARAAFDESIRLNEDDAVGWHNRAILFDRMALVVEAEKDRETADSKNPDLPADKLMPDFPYSIPLVDVWSRHNEVVGSKLHSKDKHAQLVILQLETEFMATENMDFMDLVEAELNEVRVQAAEQGITGLYVGVSGSAAVGSDMLRSAAESIENTELYTICLVILILLVVYRAPLLITVPLLTIALSLLVATGLLAAMTQLNTLPGMSWWGFKVFKTSKIFIVVILFGAGTDFCLFLIARFREELSRGLSREEAVSVSLAGVGDALTASAMTTILGLGMMYFADFGKFRNSGPAIGVCLAVALFASLTLAPALLRALGGSVFWPWTDLKQAERSGKLLTPFWHRLTDILIRYPGRILVVSLLVLAPFATAGVYTAEHVTFDLLSELAPSRASISGTQLLRRHFPVGESGPVIVLASKPGAGFDTEEKKADGLAGIFDLTKSLSEVEGVIAVRSLAEPLGEPPKRLSLVSSAGRQKLFLREHRLTKAIYLAQAPEYAGEVTRLELILKDDPFSTEALQTLYRIEERLEHVAETDSFWSNATFSYAGTTAGIRDLRTVTRSDNRRIQLLVVIAVFLVLLAILRHPAVCLYLIASVLFSYLVTIGATELFFQWMYGDTFHGLDWKVPIFLFVILVAVGEDYNIYLVTRVFEEQKRLGPVEGLREGLIRTGGIITSCGIIMAGTFISMTTGTLRGIVELGFALSLGVLLDTLVVRTILVPAFLTLLFRQTGRTSNPTQTESPEVAAP